MNTEKLKEEIRLLERKLELLKQINKIQTFPVCHEAYPFWSVTSNNGTVTILDKSEIPDMAIKTRE